MKLLVTLEPDETGMIVAEALDNIREAIAGCLEMRSASGMPLTIAVREVEVPA